MCGAVPGPAQHVEHLRHLVGDDAALLERAEQVELARRSVGAITQHTGVGRGVTRERLAQLPQRDQRQQRIDRERALGRAREPQVQRAVRREEREARGAGAIQRSDPHQANA